jgi:hypothetical protein
LSGFKRLNGWNAVSDKQFEPFQPFQRFKPSE